MRLISGISAFPSMLSALQRVSYLLRAACQIVLLFLRLDGGHAGTNSAGTRGCWVWKERDTANHLADSIKPPSKAEAPSCHWVRSNMTARNWDPEPITDASFDMPWLLALCQLLLAIQSLPAWCLCAPVVVACWHLRQSKLSLCSFPFWLQVTKIFVLLLM